ncbi:unnamed protein product [Prunus armeniaca]
MERGALRSRGDSITAFQTVSFAAFGLGLQNCGREEGEMLDKKAGARAEGKSLQSVHDRVLLGTNIAPTSLDSSVAAWAEAERIPRDGPFAFPLNTSRRPSSRKPPFVSLNETTVSELSPRHRMCERAVRPLHFSREPCPFVSYSCQYKNLAFFISLYSFSFIPTCSSGLPLVASLEPRLSHIHGPLRHAVVEAAVTDAPSLPPVSSAVLTELPAIAVLGASSAAQETTSSNDLEELYTSLHDEGGSSTSAPLDEDSRAVAGKLREFLFFGVHQMTTTEAFMEFRSCLDTAMAMGLLDSAQLDEL